MKEGVCKLCGAITYGVVKTKNYCGTSSEIGSCAHVRAKEHAKEWNRKNAAVRYSLRKQLLSSQKSTIDWRRIDGKHIEMGWLNF